MSRFEGHAGLSEATIEAVVIRANGEIEDLGVVAEYKPQKIRKYFKAKWKQLKAFIQKVR